MDFGGIYTEKDCKRRSPKLEQVKTEEVRERLLVTKFWKIFWWVVIVETVVPTDLLSLLTEGDITNFTTDIKSLHLPTCTVSIFLSLHKSPVFSYGFRSLDVLTTSLRRDPVHDWGTGVHRNHTGEGPLNRVVEPTLSARLEWQVRRKGSPWTDPCVDVREGKKKVLTRGGWTGSFRYKMVLRTVSHVPGSVSPLSILYSHDNLWEDYHRSTRGPTEAPRGREGTRWDLPFVTSTPQDRVDTPRLK